MSIAVGGVSIESTNDKRFVLEFANCNDVITFGGFVDTIGNEVCSFSDDQSNALVVSGIRRYIIVDTIAVITVT